MAEGGGKRAPGRRAVARIMVAAGIGLALLAALAAVRPLPSAADMAGSDAAKKGFVEVQDAMAKAQALDDPTPARGYLTGAALEAFNAALESQRSRGLLIEGTLRPAAMDLDRVPDPADANFTTRVHASGFVTLTYRSATTHETTQSVRQRFDIQAWMTQEQGHWMIADEHDGFAAATAQDEWLATRGLPVIPLGAGGLALLGGAGVLAVRDGRRAAESKAAGEPAMAPPAEEPPRGLVIRTFGGLRVTVDGRDITQELLSRPIAGFIWLYLMVRELEHPDRRTGRGDLAEEAFPGLPREVQRTRLRDRLTRMRRDLPQELGERLVLDGETVGLNLAGAEVDVQRLHVLAATEARDQGWLRDSQLLLEESRGRFLEGWDDITRVTEGRGSSPEVVEQLGGSLAGVRVDLIRDVGRVLLEGGDGARAASVLEEGVEVRADREDVRALLARAYAQSGQFGRAEALQKDA